MEVSLFHQFLRLETIVEELQSEVEEACPQPRRDPPIMPVPVVAVQRAAKPRQPDLMERFGAWLRENWVYAVSGVSLALAGVFLVQYGMERGLLPPGLRVMAGIAFGLALIGGGEVIRADRRERATVAPDRRAQAVTEKGVHAHRPSTRSAFPCMIFSITSGL